MTYLNQSVPSANILNRTKFQDSNAPFSLGFDGKNASNEPKTGPFGLLAQTSKQQMNPFAEDINYNYNVHIPQLIKIMLNIYTYQK